LVRLSVISQQPDWNPLWVRWNYVVRVVPELLGGVGVSGQDRLSVDNTTLQLLLRPNETREVTLSFQAALDGATMVGAYPFTVVLTDVDAENEPGAAHPGPTLDKVRGILHLHYPTATYLNYLPALYQEAMREERLNTESELPPFFERYLAGMESSQASLRATIPMLYRLFSPLSAPADFLPWLATWVALTVDEDWSELKRRRLIREAVTLYRWRGTARGLSRYLEIYTGTMPIINDKPVEGMRLGTRGRLGAKETMLGDIPPHFFVVTLPVADPEAVNETTVRRIIDAQKPAHAAYRLAIVYRK
jgi:phage tail-like protein